MPDNQRREKNQVGDKPENKRLNAKLGPLENSGAAVNSRVDANREKKVTKKLQNVTAQIEFLQAEKRELLDVEKTSLKKIHDLKTEKEDYWVNMCKPDCIGELKKYYETEIKEMETKIADQNFDIAERKEMIQSLYEQKRQLTENIEYAKTALTEKQRLRIAEKTGPTLENMEDEFKEILRQKQDLEKSVHDSQLAIGVRLESEQRVLQNVREAISMARDALAEKEAAQKRQQIMEKECDSLATNIGQIIDKATRNAEVAMEDSRKKFKERQLILLDEQLKLQEQIQNQIKFNKVLHMRCNRLAEKCKSFSEQIENLNLQLKSAVTALTQRG